MVDNPSRLEGFLDELASVTPADVLRVAKSIFPPITAPSDCSTPFREECMIYHLPITPEGIIRLLLRTVLWW